MVASGNTNATVEVIDLLGNPSTTFCRNLPEFPQPNVTDGLAAIFNASPLICGGATDNEDEFSVRWSSQKKSSLKKQGGLPSFKKVKKYKSFTLKGRVGYKIEDNKIIINKHNYKFWLSRPINGEIKTLTVKRDSLGDLYICISLEMEEE